jgi:hypothetical protein
MNAFSPVLVMLVIWFAIIIPVILVKKGAELQKRNDRQTAQNKPAGDNLPAPEKQAGTDRLKPLTPTISLTAHDDSIYQGSMNAVTGEGYDPCHDEQLAPLTHAEQPSPLPQPVQTQPGLPFGWTGSDIVKGIVMSEILKRKH